MSESSSESERRSGSTLPERAGKVAYALLFVVALPLLLVVWARAVDRLAVFPVAEPNRLGWVLVATGALMSVSAIVVLRTRGKGWPMSPFPPERLVTTGAYAVVAHPIYVGCVLIAFGVSVALGSAAGLWLVSPVLALACIAFVVGYESDVTRTQLGDRVQPAVIHLPDRSDSKPALSDRLSVYFLVFLPWYLLVEGVNGMGTSASARRAYMPWELGLPVVGWTEIAYFLGYVVALAAPLVAGSNRELRRFVVRGWFATIVVVTVYITFPVYCQAKPVPEGTPFATLLLWERMFEEPSTAFPSFHVIWAMLAMQTIVRRHRRWSVAGWLLVGVISVSCVTTGMHAVADIVAGLGFGLVFMNADELWRLLLRGCEVVAGSWREVTIGGVRLINHGFWAALGGFVGLLVVFALLDGRNGSIALITAASIVGAALWAQWLEGSSALLRPYGFYGGLLAGVLAISVIGARGGDWIALLGAFAVGVPFAQAIGRLRCLVQGCCHGRPTNEQRGMRYDHPRSRVVRLSDLAGVPLHATQLYSILGNLLIGVLLLRAWDGGLPMSLIAGLYFILSSLLRFVEEHYRGEPQTKVIGGLRVYQWLAIAGVVAGAALQTIPSAAASGVSWPTTSELGICLAALAVAYAAYGVDFPRSNRRFSRLAP